MAWYRVGLAAVSFIYVNVSYPSLLTLCSAAFEAAPPPFSSQVRGGGSSCNGGIVFRSSQSQVPGLPPASCSGLQASSSAQDRLRRSCTAHTLAIRTVALRERASC